MAQDHMAPQRLVELNQPKSGQEEATRSSRNVEVRRPAREIGCIECEDRWRSHSMAGMGGARVSETDCTDYHPRPEAPA